MPMRKGKSISCLGHVFHLKPSDSSVPPLTERIFLIAVEYKNRVWEGKSVYITGAPVTTSWRAFQNYFGLVGLVEVRPNFI